MKFLRDTFDKFRPEKGSPLYYPFEAIETLFYAPDSVTPNKGAHIRDAIDLKRLMVTVILSMIPALLFGMWNVGHQHFLAIGENAATLGDKFLLGATVVLPIVIVSYGAGLTVEFIFSSIRKHPINEGFLVTGMLIPLVVPPTIPLWQVAVATVFAVVLGKEVFGGTGMNILNVALTARAFLYFAYPSQISGEVWTYLGDAEPVSAYTGATALSIATETTGSVVDALSKLPYITGDVLSDYFMGAVPGSIGETSVLMCLIGAVILFFTGTGSWRIILSTLVGAYLMALLLNVVGAPDNAYMQMAPEYHLVIGGLMFAAVFMATDPVTATHTETGKWIYGFMIGVLTIIIRVINPAYPEGVMLAILLMNVFAPLIDYYVVQANKNRRLRRATV